MSRLSKFATKETVATTETYGTAVTNFMGGNSFQLGALQTLKIIAASSIFAEPQYYRDGLETAKKISNLESIRRFSDGMFVHLYDDSTTAVDVFTKAVDLALSTDFKATLDLALELRTEYYMRLNPAVIYVRAVEHSNRVSFNEANPGYMKKIGKSLALRPDDLTNQFDYYMFLKSSKKGLPSILKRTWAERLEEYSRYQLNKYKGKSLIDLVRLSHANNDDINELMKTGTLKVSETEQTWETLKSAGKTWTEILNTIKIPHMALLRNLRGIFTEVQDRELAKTVLAQLKGGVEKGMQFPYRYWSAYKATEKEDIHNKQLVLDTIEECIDLSIKAMPKLDGRVMNLCDNSGSARGAVTSEYGSVNVYEIANLSALITAAQSDEGYVGVFGDKLSVMEVSKRNGILSQLKESNKIGEKVGQSTENGIWLFWDKAIKNKEIWDTVFIYSDMQAGTGQLYGTAECAIQYKDFVFQGKGYSNKYIDVFALVKKYRSEVNPKVNVFSVQVAGYDNNILPASLYRGAILTGWTGRETLYAKAIIDTWNEVEKVKNGNSKNS